MADNQFQKQLDRFIKRGRGRRRPEMVERPVRQARVPQYRPAKRSQKRY